MIEVFHKSRCHHNDTWICGRPPTRLYVSFKMTGIILNPGVITNDRLECFLSLHFYSENIRTRAWAITSHGHVVRPR